MSAKRQVRRRRELHLKKGLGKIARLGDVVLEASGKLSLVVGVARYLGNPSLQACLVEVDERLEWREPEGEALPEYRWVALSALELGAREGQAPQAAREFRAAQARWVEKKRAEFKEALEVEALGGKIIVTPEQKAALEEADRLVAGDVAPEEASS